jgi:GAF domain-containing protein
VSEDTATSARIEELERRLAAEREIRERLVAIAAQLNSTFRLDELLDLVLAAATDLLEAEAGSLMLADEETGDLTIEVTSGSSDVDLAHSRIPAGQGIVGWAIEHREAVIVDDPASDPRFYGDVDASTGFTTNDLLVVPMFVRDRPIGVVELINKLGETPFSEADIGLASAFAGLAAIALDNAALYGKLTDAVVTARMSYRLG